MRSPALAASLAASIAFAVSLGGCSAAGPGSATSVPPGPEAGVRSSPVVAGRPARVFVMAALGKTCEPAGEPQITIDRPPTKGAVSLVPGQETTIQTSLTGGCAGGKAKGTGIYYTARAGETGADTFAVTARLPTGEVATRSFEVRIEP